MLCSFPQQHVKKKLGNFYNAPLLRSKLYSNVLAISSIQMIQSLPSCHALLYLDCVTIANLFCLCIHVLKAATGEAHGNRLPQKISMLNKQSRCGNGHSRHASSANQTMYFFPFSSLRRQFTAKTLFYGQNTFHDY